MRQWVIGLRAESMIAAPPAMRAFNPVVGVTTVVSVPRFTMTMFFLPSVGKTMAM
jgi:hypothetical protein